MKNSFTLILILSVMESCINPPSRDCENFKTGTFTFTTIINGEEKTTTFVRNEKIEVEEFNGVRDTATVRWINDCEYVLKKINPKNIVEEKSIHIKILTTSDKSYTFEYNAIGSPQKFSGEAIKIH